jgi:photosystem II stability/assembly factor-like uncharacterized protein
MKVWLCFLITLSLGMAQRLSAQSNSNIQGWQLINSGTTDALAPVSFQDSSIVWAGGLTVLRSTDVGVTWTNAIVPNAGSPYFTTSRDAFLVSYKDTIFRTRDGGQSWIVLHSTMPYTTAVAALSPQTIHLAGLSWVGRSTDRGNTWQVQALNTPSLNAITFADSLHGFVVGDLQPGPKPGIQEAAFFRTSDGGVNWTQVFIGFSQDLTAVYALSPKELIAAGGNTILRSVDAGDSWHTVSSGVRYASKALDFSGAYGFAVGYGGAILATSDSGNTWHEQNNHTHFDLNSVAMFDSTHAIASGEEGTLIRTNNGGKAWVEDFQNKAGLNLVVSPNPAHAQSQVTYTVPTSQHVSLYLVSAIGEVVAIIVSNELEQGDVSHSMSLESVPSGSYFVVLESPSYHGLACLSVSH